MSEVLERVNRGAALLDEFDPGWWEVIELETLDIGSARRCVLGQWAEANQDLEWVGNYSDALPVVLGRGSTYKREKTHGFLSGLQASVTDLTDAWREAILWREYLDDQGLLP
jgi:hypothetical protein